MSEQSNELFTPDSAREFVDDLGEHTLAVGYPDELASVMNAARDPLLARIAELEAINKLAVEFREASKITLARVNSEEFWATANEADVDEIELEETLACHRLFSAIDAAIRGNE